MPLYNLHAGKQCRIVERTRSLTHPSSHCIDQFAIIAHRSLHIALVCRPRADPFIEREKATRRYHRAVNCPCSKASVSALRGASASQAGDIARNTNLFGWGCRGDLQQTVAACQHKQTETKGICQSHYRTSTLSEPVSTSVSGSYIAWSRVGKAVKRPAVCACR